MITARDDAADDGSPDTEDEVLAENLLAASGNMDVAEDACDKEEVEEAGSLDDIADGERLDGTAPADGPVARSGGTHAEQADSLCGALVEFAPVDRDETAACSSRESDDGDLAEAQKLAEAEKYFLRQWKSHRVILGPGYQAPRQL